MDIMQDMIDYHAARAKHFKENVESLLIALSDIRRTDREWFESYINKVMSVAASNAPFSDKTETIAEFNSRRAKWHDLCAAKLKEIIDASRHEEAAVRET